ncbi:hypothetical protein ACVMHY_000540 [Bradyrhizobium barranii subsp. barranii]
MGSVTTNQSAASSSYAKTIRSLTIGNYRSRIISTTRVGGAAMVMVAEDGCWGSAAFVDFFTVTRIGGAWKITNKTFAHSGGEIPNEVLND